MVWYIRFQKSPKLDQQGHVRSLVTITTDLGDAFYPADLKLNAIVVAAEDVKRHISEWQTVYWKSGMRTLWIDIANVDAISLLDLRLVVNAETGTEWNVISFESMPEVLGVWSDSFDWDKRQAGSMIERRYRTHSGPERIIMEETGESIARHIW